MGRNIGLWRSIHGYGAAHLVNGRLLLCGYDIALHLWRDAKYDGIVEANGIPFRVEIKSTGLNKDPGEDDNAQFTFTSGGRSGKQIDRTAASREKVISTSDVDFAIGVNSHNSNLWIIPAEIFQIIGATIKLNFAGKLFHEKVGIFLGVAGKFTSLEIKNGFSHFTEEELTEICNERNITISNRLCKDTFDHQWKKSRNRNTLEISRKNSLILDIWEFIYANSDPKEIYK